MGKGLISILVGFFFCFFTDEVQGCVRLEEGKLPLVISQATAEVFSTATGTPPAAIDHKVKRVLPASRCCTLEKYVSSPGIALSFLVAGERPLLQSSSYITVAKSSHLPHIYPFHHFW